MNSIECNHCHEFFSPRSKRAIYCSPECRYDGNTAKQKKRKKEISKKLLEDHICLVCDKSLPSLKTKFCSIECKAINQRNKRSSFIEKGLFDRRCDNCNGTIPVDRRSDAKYCTDLCGQRVRLKRHYNNHYDKIADKRRKYNSDSKRRILQRVKSRCLKKGIPFSITEEDLEIPTECPVLGIPLVERNNNPELTKGYRPEAPSVDRIDPRKGYVKGNVRMISARANLLKSDASVKELELVLLDLKRIESEY